MTVPHILPWALLAGLLLAAIVTDLRARQIPNRLTLAVAMLAPLAWWAGGLAIWPDVALRVAAALAVFGLFMIPWTFGAMGGGDVKLIAALALWFPLFDEMRLLFVMALAGGVVTLAMLLRHRWSRAEGVLEIPYGVAVAAAGMWVISERYLYQFA